MPIQTRVTEMLGIEKPIIQAAMGWIARAPLASAMSNAGGMGIIETSSGELDAIRGEILKMHDLTDKPFGVNVAQAFVRDPDIVKFIIDQGVKSGCELVHRLYDPDQLAARAVLELHGHVANIHEALAIEVVGRATRAG